MGGNKYLGIGVVLIILGIILLIAGYNQIQPSAVEQGVSFLENLTSTHAPADLHPSKAPGYAMMFFGAVSAGLGLVLALRKSSGEK